MSTCEKDGRSILGAGSTTCTASPLSKSCSDPDNGCLDLEG